MRARCERPNAAFAFVAWAMTAGPLAAQPEKAPDYSDLPGQRVFVCGHSFLNHLFGRFANVAKSAGIKDHRDVNLEFLGGSRVLQHWNLPDEKSRAKKAIRAGEVDVLALSPNATVPDEGIDRFVDLLLEHNPKGRVYVQGSWYPHDLPGKSGKSFVNADRDAMTREQLLAGYKTFYEALTQQIRETNTRLAPKQGRQVVFFVPVGHAAYELRDRIAKGTLPGLSKQSDLHADAIGHATPPLTALTAYCHFAAVYGRTPVGLPLPRVLSDAKNPARDLALNRVLQEIAWEATLREPLSGVRRGRD